MSPGESRRKPEDMQQGSMAHIRLYELVEGPKKEKERARRGVGGGVYGATTQKVHPKGGYATLAWWLQPLWLLEHSLTHN